MDRETYNRKLFKGPLARKGGLLFPLFVLLLTAMPFSGCSKKGGVTPPAGTITVTIQPLAFLIEAMVEGTGVKVHRLVPPGFSPVLYEFTSSDLTAVSGSPVTFYVSRSMEVWMDRLPSRKNVEVLPLVPGPFQLEAGEEEGESHHDGEHDHDHGPIDPHFWNDPLTVRATLPAIESALCEAIPENCNKIKENRIRFSGELDRIHGEMEQTLAPVRGGKVALFHPSFRYLLNRYGLQLSAVIEPFPGTEPGPAYLARLTGTIRSEGVRALFTEPQLPPGPAKVISEATGVPLFELDPLGGVEGRNSLIELYQFNAKVLVQALGGASTGENGAHD